MSHAPSRHHRIIVVMAAMLFALLVPGTVAAEQVATFSLYLTDSCISGHATPNAEVHVTWKDDSGLVKGTTDVTASATVGSWDFCLANPGGIYDPVHALEVGDRLRAQVGGTSRRFVVPNVSMTINRVADRIKGTAPAGDRVRLQWLLGDQGFGANVRADSNGMWSFHLADMGGGFGVSADWSSEVGDSVSLDIRAPYVTLTMGSAAFVGEAKAGAIVGVDLYDSEMALKGSGAATTDGYGAFHGDLTDGSDPVVVGAGDSIVVSGIGSDAHWTVPNVTVSATRRTDVVHAHCADTGLPRTYVIEVSSPDGTETGYAFGNAEPGPFDVDFTEGETGWFVDPVDIKGGYSVTLTCVQDTGDKVRAIKTLSQP